VAAASIKLTGDSLSPGDTFFTGKKHLWHSGCETAAEAAATRPRRPI